MLGKHSPQGELFRPDNVHLNYVGRESIYGFLAEERHRLFRDEDYRSLYSGERGRPSVPPSQLCIALLLQTKDGVSDEEAIQRSAYDLRWKVALGIDMEGKLCAKSTLQLFRAKLVLHEDYQRIFMASLAACKSAGLLRKKSLDLGLDTTPVFGRGAVKDTFNLVSDQIVRVVRAAAQLGGLDRDQVIAEQGLTRHFSSSFKSQFDVDWSDDEQKRAVLAQLVGDARVAQALGKKVLASMAADSEEAAELRGACDLLSELLQQDIEESPGDGGGPRIKQGTEKDRKVSTTDPEMRHGRKSASKTFSGYKASVAADVDEGVVLATGVIPANAHDSEGAAELAAEAGTNADKSVNTVLCDTAYGSMDVRAKIEKATKGASVISKAPPLGKRKGVEFTATDFEVDFENGVARCPAGKTSSSHGRDEKTGNHTFSFSRKDCTDCPLRSKCTTSKANSRKLHLSQHHNELQALRELQKTEEFKALYRRRTRVEHRIARLAQLGIRQARYNGRAKVAYQVSIAAAFANLVVAMGAASRAVQALLNGLRRLPKWVDAQFAPAIALSRRNVRALACDVRPGRIPRSGLENGTFRPGF